jgi:pimeloyl-ACP methyl ester carboxylesterase
MKRLILALLTVALAASSPAYSAVKTIVLVHGAFADGSGWKPVADILQSHGYSVRVVQEPETSFASDTQAAHAVLEELPLGKAHLMTFQLTPIGPLNPLRQLLVPAVPH